MNIFTKLPSHAELAVCVVCGFISYLSVFALYNLLHG